MRPAIKEALDLNAAKEEDIPSSSNSDAPGRGKRKGKKTAPAVAASKRYISSLKFVMLSLYHLIVYLLS